MKEIRLKKLVDDKKYDLQQLSKDSVIPYSTLKDWYDTSNFDGDQVGIHELTDLAGVLGVELTELIDLP
jgi:hypothetical protein